MTIQKPEPVAYVNKKIIPSLKNAPLLSLAKHNVGLYLETDMEAYAQARVDAVLNDIADKILLVDKRATPAGIAAAIRALKGKV